MRSRRAAITLVCLVATATLLYYFRGRSVGVLRTVQATLIQLDPAQHTATVQFIHPRSGEIITLQGTASTECHVELDGRPAGLADLVVGDRVWVQGLISRNNTVSAVHIWVYRQEPMPAQAPITAVADETHDP